MEMETKIPELIKRMYPSEEIQKRYADAMRYAGLQGGDQLAELMALGLVELRCYRAAAHIYKKLGDEGTSALLQIISRVEEEYRLK